MSVSEAFSPELNAVVDSLGTDLVAAGNSSDAIDGIVPQAVASPRTSEQLCRLLSIANAEGLAIAPRGGGTQLALGNRLRRLDIVADLTALDRIVQHNAADLTLAVEAGITLSSLRAELAAEGQFLPLDAPLPDNATVGGTLAAGISGPLKWQYGSARDLVIGMKVAQPDGRITQSGGNVVKNVSGYDMARLHVGGLGTLGVITEVSFKLTPLPRDETTLIGHFGAIDACMSAALGIFNSGVMPLAMTLFNRTVSDKVLSSDEQSEHLALAVRLGGRPRTLRRMENEAFFVIRESTAAVERLDDDSGDLWSALADYGNSEGDLAEMSARISVLPGRLGEATEALSRNGEPAIVAHPGYGMMNAHWFNSGADLRDAIHATREEIHRIGGTFIVERAPFEVKDQLDIWDYTGDSLDIMRRLKEQYDPNGILNPNRFIGGI